MPTDLPQERHTDAEQCGTEPVPCCCKWVSLSPPKGAPGSFCLLASNINNPTTNCRHPSQSGPCKLTEELRAAPENHLLVVVIAEETGGSFHDCPSTFPGIFSLNSCFSCLCVRCTQKLEPNRWPKTNSNIFSNRNLESSIK